MLNMKKMELDFFPDPDMYVLFEKCTRDEVSYISNRYEDVTSRISIWNLKTQNRNQNIYTYTLTYLNAYLIYMVMLCLSSFQQVVSNG